MRFLFRDRQLLNAGFRTVQVYILGRGNGHFETKSMGTLTARIFLEEAYARAGDEPNQHLSLQAGTSESSDSYDVRGAGKCNPTSLAYLPPDTGSNVHVEPDQPCKPRKPGASSNQH